MTFKSPLQKTPVAVIGMASIFPQARTLSTYWENILARINCIGEVPPSRWNPEDYYHPDPSTPDKTYCKRGGFIPDVDFDPLEFGLPPNILEVTDVSQLLGLVVAKEALEDAGYGEGRPFSRETTGVVLGVVGMSSKLFSPLMSRLQYPVWGKVLRSYGLPEESIQKIIAKIKLAYVGWEENSFPGTIGNVIAGRIANRFDLGGTNCVVDAACASSLAAIKLAVSELTGGHADMMITGGVDTDNSISTYLCFSKTPAFSKGDGVRPFDADSDGMMVGEGLGMLVLKRLQDAERDGDRIYAVIRGIGSSSDGRFKSIYAPRPAGQAVALRRAYQEAGFDPASVGLIEAHGTGTMAGDPAEFEALREVFSRQNPRRQHIALGSVKSQIAHTKATAGAASMIKAALALHHKTLPPTLNVSRPNPKLKIEETPFYLNTETRPWFTPKDTPRRAGVSSFGFGGTNFHIVLEEYQPEQASAYRVNHVPQAVLLAAGSPQELLETCRQVLAQVKSSEGQATLNALVLESRGLRIPTASARLGFLASSVDEAAELLQLCTGALEKDLDAESWEHPRGIYYRRGGLDPQGKVVALFPGQGSQYVDMGRELAVNFPPARRAFASADELFSQDRRSLLSEVVYPLPAFDAETRGAQAETLQRTANAQPAIGVLSAAMLNLLREAGFQADFYAGHSFGELTALWAAGVFSQADFFNLAKERGEAMAPPADPNFDAGSMLAVKTSAEKVLPDLKDFPEISLANDNSPQQVVLAGPKVAITGVQAALGQRGYSTVPLPVSAAFHTPLVSHASKPFAGCLENTVFQPPQGSVYSNTTAQPYPVEPSEIRGQLSAHMLNPVRFKEELEAIYSAGGRIFVEIGPKNVLTNLVNATLGDRSHVAVALNGSSKKDSDRQMREAVVALRVAGLPLVGFDPYAKLETQASARKPSPATVKLNGGYYLSEKTRSAFTQALASSAGEELFPPAKTTAPAPLQGINPMSVQLPASSALLGETSATPAINPASGVVINDALEHLFSQQSETLHLHEQYLHAETEFNQLFAGLARTEMETLAQAGSNPTALALLDRLENNLARFQEHQDHALRIHEAYLQNQTRLAENLLGLCRNSQGGWNSDLACPQQPQQNAAVSGPLPEKSSPKPAPLPPGAGLPEERPNTVETPRVQQVEAIPHTPQADETAMTAALLTIVSEKTGYPQETLDLDMDMEADLGIDSIKRVEILGAMQALYPDLPKLAPETLAEMRTLKQIVSAFSAAAPQPVQAEPAAAEQPGVEAVEKAATLPGDGQTGGEADVLLAIVSEKTGYPRETLDLDMDMEADLGIDSIKRVEILGAMQAQYPDLPKLAPETLAELRTLRQILSAYSSTPQKAGGEDAPASEVSAPAGEVVIPRSVPELKPLPAPDALDFDLPAGEICLMTDDGTPAALLLAASLQQRGWKVVLLSLPCTPQRPDLPEGLISAALAGWSEAQLQQCLDEITARHGSTGVFIHLDPAENDRELHKSILKHVFLIARQMKAPLTAAASQGRAAFISVAHLDGAFGLGENEPGFDPLSGGLFGLVKTLSLEWPQVFCRALDVHPGLAAEETARLVLAELFDPNRLLVEVAVNPQGRFTLVAEPEPEMEMAA